MRILFLTPYFPPEVGAPQTRIYELALRLQKLGHEVVVLTTFPNYPTGTVPARWRGKFFWKGVDQSIRVYRVWSYASPNKGFYLRLLSQLSFAIFASLAGLLLPCINVILVESPPLFDGFAGMFISRIRRTPYIFNVADLWPDVAVETGMLNNPMLIQLARAMERLFYQHAALVLAVTAGVRQRIIDRGIAPAKVALFRNAVDTRFFFPRTEIAQVRRDLGISNSDFLVTYAGTLGLGQQVDTILDAAAQFQQRGEHAVKFIFFGDGSEKEKLQQKARELDILNVRFLGLQPKADMPELLSASDCILVSIRDVAVLQSALPTKMFEAMACARPVVLVARGEAVDVLEEAAAGVCALPGNVLSIYNAIRHVQNDAARALAMGQRGREYVALHFNRDQRAQQLSRILEGLVRQAINKNRALSYPIANEKKMP